MVPTRLAWGTDSAASAFSTPGFRLVGFRLGARHLRAYLGSRRDIGVNHVALNLRFNRADVERTLKRLAEDILPDFQE